MRSGYGTSSKSPRRHPAGATLLSRYDQAELGTRYLCLQRSSRSDTPRHDSLWRDEDWTTGPTRSEAVVGFLQGLASTPNATRSRLRRNSSKSNAPLRSYSGWRRKAKWLVWSPTSRARSQRQPTAQPFDVRAVSCVHSCKLAEPSQKVAEACQLAAPYSSKRTPTVGSAATRLCSLRDGDKP